MSRNRRRKMLIRLMCAFIFCGVSVVFASVPTTINYQGKLTNDQGQLVPDGTYHMRFFLFDAESIGNQLWNNPNGEQRAVSVNGGIYNLQLGATEPLDSTIFEGGEVWLEIAIYKASTSNWETLSPRQQITSTGFAFKAGDADTLEGKTVGQILGNTTGNGLEVTATNDGVHVVSAGDHGVFVGSAGYDGVFVHSAGGHGVKVSSVNYDGVNVYSAGRDGVSVASAGSPTTMTSSSRNNGFEVQGAEGHGLYVGRADFSGVMVESAEYNGLYVASAGFAGVQVVSSDQYGVYVGSAVNHAGYFNGSVNVTGTLIKGSGTFKIDHPLDPENKYLSHSFVESPDMKNIYDGVVALDDNGEAWVELPEWFEALNRDFRYQLTCIGGFAQLYIAEKIADNTFKIAGGYAGLEVSWQVTGIRQDPFAKANPISVEADKPQEELGTYLHPEAYGMPETMGVTYKETQAILDKQ